MIWIKHVSVGQKVKHSIVDVNLAPKVCNLRHTLSCNTTRRSRKKYLPLRNVTWKQKSDQFQETHIFLRLKLTTLWESWRKICSCTKLKRNWSLIHKQNVKRGVNWPLDCRRHEEVMSARELGSYTGLTFRRSNIGVFYHHFWATMR
jgi:hypothetical protein